jgi:Spy/CpxP family protein refolding chaperone
MRKLMIVMGLGVSLFIGCIAGGAVTAAAATSSGALDFDSPSPIRLLITGQIGRLMTLRSELNLSADQRAKIKSIVQSHRQEIVAVARPIVDKRRALRDAVNAPSPDEKTIRAAANDLASSIGDAAVLASKVKAEVRGVMTPDQSSKLNDFRKASDGAVDRFINDFAGAS